MLIQHCNHEKQELTKLNRRLNSNKPFLPHNVHGSQSCNSKNKHRALHVNLEFNPSLKQNPATKVQSKVRGTLISQLRGYDGSGVFAATQLRTTQMSGRAGCVGYFGVQWIGRASENDLLLFSMWNLNPECIHCILDRVIK